MEQSWTVPLTTSTICPRTHAITQRRNLKPTESVHWRNTLVISANHRPCRNSITLCPCQRGLRLQTRVKWYNILYGCPMSDWDLGVVVTSEGGELSGGWGSTRVDLWFNCKYSSRGMFLWQTKSGKIWIRWLETTGVILLPVAPPPGCVCVMNRE